MLCAHACEREAVIVDILQLLGQPPNAVPPPQLPPPPRAASRTSSLLSFLYRDCLMSSTVPAVTQQRTGAQVSGCEPGGELEGEFVSV